MNELPERPSESDCCGSGCSPCVFDVYDQLRGKCEFENIRPSVEDEIRHDLLSPLKYHPFVLISTAQVNATASIYTFKPFETENRGDPEQENVASLGGANSENASENFVNKCVEGILPYAPGQHIIMTNAKARFGSECTFREIGTASISRCYTPLSVARKEKNCLVKLLIKLYAAGRMSSFISQLEPFEVIFFRGPFGDFRHVPNSKYLMVCAGTGLAPLYPIIETVLSDEGDETLMSLCFACATLDDILLREELRNFSKYWNFKVSIYLSQESTTELDERLKYRENIYLQKIEMDVLKELLAKDEFKVLICGSETFNRDMRDYVERCGSKDVFVF